MRSAILTAIVLSHAFALSCQRPADAGVERMIQQLKNEQSKPRRDRPLESGSFDIADENRERYRELLFVDQTLEEIIAVRDPNAAPDDLDSALGHIREGRKEEAKKLLRKVLTDQNAEIRQKLWTWKALRALGEKPPPGSADEVHGVVLEVPVDGWSDTLGAYSDGRVRYVNGKQGVLIWEVPDDEHIGPLVKSLLDAARPLVKKSRLLEKHLPPAEGVYRVTVLTFGGLRVVEGSVAAVERDRELSAVNAAGTRLFLALLKEQEENRREEKP